MNDEEAFELYQKAREVMQIAGFNLRKWNTNSPTLRAKIENELRSHGDLHSPPELKILGLSWNTESDELYVDVTELITYMDSLVPTKRSVLKFSAKVFDPLGFLGPFTVKQKILFQELCCEGVNWDDPLDGEALKLWKCIPNDLQAISRVRVQRCYFSQNKRVISCQLHGFSDASERAFAAVVYLRVEYQGQTPEISLVASKTRVAPIKKQSIPRLELLGATILARLMDTVKSSLVKARMSCELLNVYYWTDSYTTLCWIRNNHNWKQYVQHRVNEIHHLSDREQWRFCPGVQNPADLPSRGCCGEELACNNNWWEGPEFLHQPKSAWPVLSTPVSTPEAGREMVKHPPALTHVLATTEAERATNNLEKIMDVTRYSSKVKLLRVTATVIKVAQFWKKKGKNPQSWIPIEAVDLSKAEERWIQTIQQNCFSEEFKLLKSGDQIKNNRRITQLNLFLDKENFIRCRGRVSNADVPEVTKSPLLLPARHRFTSLLVQSVHNNIFHNGIRETLNAVRERYWIIRGRETVKQVLRRCVVCRKYQGYSLTTPKVAELPPDRVADAPPFCEHGSGFCGATLCEE